MTSLRSAFRIVAPKAVTDKNLLLTTFLRLAIATIFLLAATGKAFDFAGLIRSIERVGWLPGEMVTPAAALLIAVEFMTGLFLFYRPTADFGAISASALSALFIAVTGTFVARHETEACSCLGVVGKLPPPVMLGIDVLLLGVSLWAVARILRHPSELASIVAKNDERNKPSPVLTGPRLLLRRFGLAIIMIEMLILIRLIPSDPVLAAKIGSLFQSNRVAQQVQFRRDLMKSDPAKGQTMPNPPGANLNPFSSTESSATEKTVIVFVGHCTGCNKSVFQAWEQAHLIVSNIRVILVSQDTSENIRQFVTRNKYTLPVYSTTDEYARAFNAVWTPRAAVVDQENRLIWIEDAIPTAPEGVIQQYGKSMSIGRTERKR